MAQPEKGSAMQRTTPSRVALIAFVLCVATLTSAQAQTPLDELIAPEKGRSACFVRVYDAAHLRQHPKQRITSMRVWMRYEELPGDVEGLALDLGVGLVQRGDPQPFYAQGDCIWDKRANINTSDRRMIKELNKDEAAGCLMSAQPDVFEASSAEEGGVLLLDRGKDNNTLMVYLDDRLTMVKRATRGKHVLLRFGADDRVFVLRRTDPKECAAVEDAVATPEPGVEPRSR